jgi:Fe-S-cluster containining protein
MMELFNVKPLGKKEQFQFKCTRCGDCCRKIKESVMLESLDAYRLAKFLRQADPSIREMGEMLLKYADPIPLTDTGFPIYVL